ncbi:hypothetical protein C8J57DRAFT_1238872 [Mycena rebaudengoi]|nr:hypothetical protein C8J57DRAFT_1238872 [Mycena rebaudengoi]
MLSGDRRRRTHTGHFKGCLDAQVLVGAVVVDDRGHDGADSLGSGPGSGGRLAFTCVPGVLDDLFRDDDVVVSAHGVGAIARLVAGIGHAAAHAAVGIHEKLAFRLGELGRVLGGRGGGRGRFGTFALLGGTLLGVGVREAVHGGKGMFTFLVDVGDSTNVLVQGHGGLGEKSLELVVTQTHETQVVMPTARPGLKAAAWARPGRAWASRI